MGHKITFTNIVWDTESDDISENELVVAPSEYVFNLTDKDYKDYSEMTEIELEEVLSDMLSDIFGWAVINFDYELS